MATPSSIHSVLLPVLKLEGIGHIARAAGTKRNRSVNFIAPKEGRSRVCKRLREKSDAKRRKVVYGQEDNLSRKQGQVGEWRQLQSVLKPKCSFDGIAMSRPLAELCEKWN